MYSVGRARIAVAGLRLPIGHLPVDVEDVRRKKSLSEEGPIPLSAKVPLYVLQPACMSAYSILAVQLGGFLRLRFCLKRPVVDTC